MIEPELAFADLEDDMAVAEAYLKHCTRWVKPSVKLEGRTGACCIGQPARRPVVLGKPRQRAGGLLASR
jgi:hypothetical protein